MPPNPGNLANQIESASTPAPASWPGGSPLEASATVVSQDWETFGGVIIGKQKRETPSKTRCFYLTMSERDVNAFMTIGNSFGVEEAAILDGEAKVSKLQQTMFVFKCVGRLEFVKPKFEELEDYDESGPIGS